MVAGCRRSQISNQRCRSENTRIRTGDRAPAFAGVTVGRLRFSTHLWWTATELGAQFTQPADDAPFVSSATFGRRPHNTSTASPIPSSVSSYIGKTCLIRWIVG